MLAAVTGDPGDTVGPACPGRSRKRRRWGCPPCRTSRAWPPRSPAASLLAGSQTFQVWYSGPEHFRLALPQSMSEDDLVRNGASAWLWDSSANTVTHLTLPASAPAARAFGPADPAAGRPAGPGPSGPAGGVRVDPAVTVAGQAAYQLVLAPKGRTP